MELISDRPRKGDVYVDYAFKMRFAEVIATIEWFAEALQLPDSSAFYWNLLAYNQHDAGASLLANCYDDSGQKLVLDNSQIECHSLLVTASKDPDFSFRRAWRLYSFECASRLGQAVYIGCSTGVMACTRLFPNGQAKIGTVDNEIGYKLSEMDVAAIQSGSCYSEEDRRRIYDFLCESGGVKGMEKMSRRLQRWGAFASVPCEVIQCQAGKLDKLLSQPGLTLHAEWTKDGLGASPLHIAVAGNSVQVVQKLLAKGVPPDVADSMQETPLHYAALASYPRMVEMLLTANADPYMESVYGETPLDVAEQEVAHFLRPEPSFVHDSSRVRKLLLDAQVATSVAFHEPACSPATSRPAATSCACETQ